MSINGCEARQVLVKNLRGDAQKAFSADITLAELIAFIKSGNLSKQAEFRVMHKAKVLEDPKKRLSEFLLGSQSPTLLCVHNIKIKIFSKRDPRRMSYVVWENEKVSELMQKLRGNPKTEAMYDAIVVESQMRFSKFKTELACVILFANCEVEILERLTEVIVLLKSPASADTTRKKLYLPNHIEADEINTKLDVNQSLIMHEGLVVNDIFYGKYECEGLNDQMYVDENGHRLNAMDGKCKKAMKVLLCIPGAIQSVVPVLRVIPGLVFHALEQLYLPEKNDITNRKISNYKALFYGFRAKSNLQKAFFYRTDGGYMTLYSKKIYYRNEKELRNELTSKVAPFLLMVEDYEMVTDELSAQQSNNRQKVKVWIAYGDVWVQRLLPYKACRHFIPK